MAEGKQVRINAMAADHLSNVRQNLNEQYGISVTEIELASKGILLLSSTRIANEMVSRINNKGGKKT